MARYNLNMITMARYNSYVIKMARYNSNRHLLLVNDLPQACRSFKLFIREWYSWVKALKIPLGGWEHQTQIRAENPYPVHCASTVSRIKTQLRIGNPQPAPRTSQRINQDSPKGIKPLDCPESNLRLLAARSRAAGMPFLSSASRFYIRGSILPPWFHSPTAVPFFRRVSPVTGGRRRLGAGYTARWLTGRCCRLPFRRGMVCPVTRLIYSVMKIVDKLKCAR